MGHCRIFSWLVPKCKDECEIGKTRLHYKFQNCYVLCCNKDTGNYTVKGRYLIEKTEKCKATHKGNRWVLEKDWNGDVNGCDAKCHSGDTKVAGPIGEVKL